MVKLVKIEDDLMEELRVDIADLEAKNPPLSLEDELKLNQLKEKLTLLELDRLLRKDPKTEEDLKRIKELQNKLKVLRLKIGHLKKELGLPLTEIEEEMLEKEARGLILGEESGLESESGKSRLTA